jgi:ComF family protein
MHPKKRAERGFDQAVLLAKELSGLCRIPVLENVLIRTRYTKASRKLGREHRIANLRGAFSVTRHELLPQSVLLVDDIYTTGMTMNHAAAALRKAGVTQIYFLTLCTGRGAE